MGKILAMAIRWLLQHPEVIVTVAGALGIKSKAEKAEQAEALKNRSRN